MARRSSAGNLFAHPVPYNSVAAMDFAAVSAVLVDGSVDQSLCLLLRILESMVDVLASKGLDDLSNSKCDFG